MESMILIKYSELTLKGKNRDQFSKWLLDNFKYRFKESNIDYEYEKGFDYLIFKYKDLKNLEKAEKIIPKITGISWYSKVLLGTVSFDDIYLKLQEIFKTLKKDFKFRVSIKNSSFYPNLFKSNFEVTDLIADKILSLNKLSKVSLDNYDYNFKIKFLRNNKYQLSWEKNIGITGLPAGINGKGLLLLSGGIDSPFAGFLMIARGLNINFISFLTPRTSDKNTIDKIIKLAKKVNKFNGKNQFLYLVNFVNIQSEIAKLKATEYRTILLRRAFVKFSLKIANQNDYKTLITGDSLGQVSSQTLEALAASSNSFDFLILRPLIGFSKNEIIKKAKLIDTYDTSILPGDDMCSLFTPKNPKTKPKIEKILLNEDKILNYDDILNDILEKNVRKIKLD